VLEQLQLQTMHGKTQAKEAFRTRGLSLPIQPLLLITKTNSCRTYTLIHHPNPSNNSNLSHSPNPNSNPKLKLKLKPRALSRTSP
jgi:hypothetical protein